MLAKAFVVFFFGINVGRYIKYLNVDHGSLYSKQIAILQKCVFDILYNISQSRSNGC